MRRSADHYRRLPVQPPAGTRLAITAAADDPASSAAKRTPKPTVARLRTVPAVILWLGLIACSTPSPRPPAPVTRPESAAPTADRLAAQQHSQANEVLIRAIGLIGTPYRWGGNTPEGGFDCSGLVHFVFRDAVGLNLPRTTQALAALATPRIARSDLRTGDLLVFGGSAGVEHVGIHVGDGRFVHAPNAGGTVRIDRLDDHYWRTRFLFARRPLAAP